MTVGGPVTEEAVERRIQDAAHVLLDLCMAQNSRMPADFPHQKEMALAQSLSMAIQAIFMADYLKAGTDIQQRMKGHALDELEMRARFFGLGVGAGQCIGACTTPVATLVALEGVTSGLSHGMEMRAEALNRLRGKKP